MPDFCVKATVWYGGMWHDHECIISAPSFNAVEILHLRRLREEFGPVVFEVSDVHVVPPSDLSRLCPSLRVARERLCVAQAACSNEAHRNDLQEALNIIDRVGVFHCSDWSKFNWPSTEIDK